VYTQWMRQTILPPALTVRAPQRERSESDVRREIERLKVEASRLLARAADLEVSLGGAPLANLQPPSHEEPN